MPPELEIKVQEWQEKLKDFNRISGLFEERQKIKPEGAALAYIPGYQEYMLLKGLKEIAGGIKDVAEGTGRIVLGTKNMAEDAVKKSVDVGIGMTKGILEVGHKSTNKVLDKTTEINNKIWDASKGGLDAISKIGEGKDKKEPNNSEISTDKVGPMVAGIVTDGISKKEKKVKELLEKIETDMKEGQKKAEDFIEGIKNEAENKMGKIKEGAGQAEKKMNDMTDEIHEKVKEGAGQAEKKMNDMIDEIYEEIKKMLQ